MVTLEDVREAQRIVSGRVHRTPLLSATALGKMAQPPVRLFLKAELLQKTGSFKVRGALNKLAGMTAEEKSSWAGYRLGGQPCPGGGLERGCRGHSGDGGDG